MEAAIAVAAVVVAVVCCLGALLAVSAQIRCVDAAREAARLGARGDEGSALSAAGAVAPEGAQVTLRRDGDRVVASVTADTPLLPLLSLRAEAIAVREPGVR